MELGKSQLRMCDSNYAIHFTGNQRAQEMSVREKFKEEIKWWKQVRKEKFPKIQGNGET